MPGYLRLKVEELLKERETNLHQAHLAGGFSYPTMHRYQRYPEKVESMHTPTIVALLVDALGLTPEEIELGRFGRIFEIMTDGEREPLDLAQFYLEAGKLHMDGLIGLGDPVVAQLAKEIVRRLDELVQERAGVEPDELTYRRQIIRGALERIAFFCDELKAMAIDEELEDLVEKAYDRTKTLADALDAMATDGDL